MILALVFGAWLIVSVACNSGGNNDEETDDPREITDDDDTISPGPPSDDDDTTDDDTTDDDTADDDTTDDDTTDDDTTDDDTTDDDTTDDDSTDDDDDNLSPTDLFGTYVSFDGNDDYGSVANSAELQAQAVFTVEAWVRYANLPPGVLGHVILYKAGIQSRAGTTGGYYLALSPGGQFTFCCSLGGSFTCATSTTSVSANDWHHVVGVINGDEVHILFDGENHDSDTDMGLTPTTTDADLWVARYPVVKAGDYAAIDVEEVRISTVHRYLSSTYTVPTNPFTSDADTSALWHFDEGSGTSANDASSYNNDLTLHGGVTWN